MKILILSDLHFEFYGEDLNKHWVSSLNIQDADVCVLVGDICSYPLLDKALSQFLKFHKLPVIFVTGNHEYYHGTFEKTHEKLANIQQNFSNFHWLENDSVTISDQRFLGCCLWYPGILEAQIRKKNWSDFYHCDVVSSKIFNAADTSYKYLSDNVTSNDIIITHMLPSKKSISEKYKDNVNNCFFLHDCEKIIIDKQPKVWFHGHTHNSFDYDLGNTRVVCNPRGYPIKDFELGSWGGSSQKYENPDFEIKIIEI